MHANEAGGDSTLIQFILGILQMESVKSLLDVVRRRDVD